MKKYFTGLEIKWTTIFFIVSLLWVVFEKAMGWHGPKIHLHERLTNLFAPIAIAIYVFALLEKRKSLGGHMTWKEGFYSGAAITIMLTVLAPIGQLITSKVISPEYFPNIINYAVNEKHLKREDMEAMFNLKSYLALATISSLVMGLATSAIVSVFVRKKSK